MQSSLALLQNKEDLYKASKELKASECSDLPKLFQVVKLVWPPNFYFQALK